MPKGPPLLEGLSLKCRMQGVVHRPDAFRIVEVASPTGIIAMRFSAIDCERAGLIASSVIPPQGYQAADFRMGGLGRRRQSGDVRQLSRHLSHTRILNRLLAF